MMIQTNMENCDSTGRKSARLIRLSPDDNVLIAGQSLDAGALVEINGVTHRLDAAVGLGHKVAAKPLASGEKIIKCHIPIGSATCDIAAGVHIHTHNMKSDYLPTFFRGDDSGPK